MKEFKEPGVSLLRRDRCVAGLAALVVFVVYGLTLSPGLYVGESLWSSAQALGLSPNQLPVNAVQFWVSGVFMRLLNGMGLNVQWFSALAGALCAALLYRLTAFFVYQNIHEENCLRQEGRVSLVAGLGTVVAFAFSLGGWYASTRFTIHLMDLLLLLSAVYLFVIYARRPAFPWMLALAFLYGAGIAQSVYFIIFTPLVVLGGVFALWRNGNLSMMRFAWLTGCFVLGVVLSFTLTALVWSTTPDAALAGDVQLWETIVRMIRHYYFTMQRLLPERDWIWLLLTSSVPWLISLFIAARTLNNERLWSHYILHIAMTTSVVFALLGMVISPWVIGLANMRAMIPLFSYVMVAMTTGYLLGYWYLMMVVRRGERSRTDSESSVFIFGRPLGQIFFFSLAAFVLASSASNYVRHMTGEKEKFLTQSADEILDRLEGRLWVITNTRVDPYFLDYYLQLQASKRKIKVNVINLLATDGRRLQQNNNVRDNLIPQLPETDQQSMRNALDLGIMTFVTDLYTRYPDFAVSHIVNWGLPDMILNSGTKPVSEFVFFGNGLSWENKTADGMLDAYTQFLARMDTLLPHTKDATALIDLMRNDLRRHVSFVANNYGVALADSSKDEAVEKQAYDFFKRVVEFEPENISARINIFQIAVSSKNPDIEAEKETVETDLQNYVDSLKSKYNIFAISSHFGYVRSKELYQQLADMWGRVSGRDSTIVSELYKWTAQDPTGSGTLKLSPTIDPSLQTNEQILAALEKQIKDEPANPRAYQEIVRFCIRVQRNDEAEKWIKAAENKNFGIDFSFEHATLLLAKGKTTEAREILQGIVNSQPKQYEALSMLAFIMIDQQDVLGVQRYVLDKIERDLGTRRNYYYQLVAGKLALLNSQLAVGKKDDTEALRQMKAARDAFLSAAELRPDIGELRNMVLELDFNLGDQSNARLHAENFLRRDRTHPFASYILGSLRFQDGDYLAAEEYFRQSVASKPEARSLNDYAEVLRRLKKLDSAEKYAREAIHAAEVEKAPRYSFAAWDTLARTLCDKGQYAEAKSASNKAITIAQDSKAPYSNAQLKLTQLTIAVATSASSEASALITEIAAEITRTPESLDKLETEEFRKLRDLAAKM